ncbi:hypothetical protein J2T12_003308 [Paenibacillus anaericanus]|uniref:motility associated factor glycosyltransferase family protein n=1 Tax=Paenibacillus anaericanus TaxID=170367 RepID=UPI0027847374|nr:6-hydroxymethylpterin diphosphokinase MptE-like protein [Paenibacillus anaericanus]MDQ0089895.1 hypothetical protein [Paenibacillus anaericanus]
MYNNYKRNLSFLKSNYPNIYQFAKQRKPDLNKYNIEDAHNGEKNIIVKSPSSEYRIHSKYNPSNEANMWVDSIAHEVDQVQSILIFGFGLGYHIEKFLERYPDKTIYIYEPDESLFAAALEARNIEGLLDHRKIGILAVGSEESIRYGLVNNIAFQVKDSFSFLVLPIYNRMYHELVSELRENTEMLILNYRSNLATVIHYQYEWIENILYNMDKVLTTPSLFGLRGACKDIPAVVVGSGPSLKEDIEYIRMLRSHCLIIAAGSSLQALLHEGIEPHFVVSIDGGEPNYLVFKDLIVSDIPFVFGTTIKHTILENREGTFIHLLLDLDLIGMHLLQSQPDEPVFQTNSTVTGTCIQIANFFNCSQIILMGQDLSYPNNQYYTVGVNHVTSEQKQQILDGATEETPNVVGGMNPTTKKMLNTLRDMEHLIGLIPDIEVINTSKMGAQIKGTIYQSIEEVYEINKHRSLGTDWFKKLLEAKLTSYTTIEKEKIYSKIKSTRIEIRKIENKLQKLGAKLVDLHLSQNSSKKDVDKLLIDVDKLWKWIAGRKAFEDVYFFPLQAHVSVYMRQLPDIVNEKDSERKGEAIVTHLGGLVKEMITLTPYLLKGFDEAIKRINEREVSLLSKEN